ncbi:MAG: OmpH family outer membrane protein [Rhodobacteraceae bacterium]|nr:OmpH family outer membrane protein [Paracoccaceae bacterium]
MPSRLRFSWLLLAVFWAGIAPAQDFPTYGSSNILIINQDALFSASRLGRDILQQEERERDLLIEEGRRIGDEFIAEELDLTAQRDTLPAEEFRLLAEAFDIKVEKARAEQEANDSTLIANIEARRRAFFQVIAPVLARLMQKYGAAAIIDQRSVLLFDRNMDITREAIDLLDKAYNENPDMIKLIGPANE